MTRTTLSLVCLIAVATACGGGGGGGGGSSDATPNKVLVFSRTTGFRHPSIEAGVDAIRKLGAENDFAVDHTEDAALFASENLAQYRAVVFLSTTGNPLEQASERGALEDFIHAGGGFVGIHAASDQNEDSQTGWPWFGQLVGAYFGGHPLYSSRPAGDESCQFGPIVSCHDGTALIEDDDHPATAHLARASSSEPPEWHVYDEFYGFATNPRGSVHVLASLDESTYLDVPEQLSPAGRMGDDHPIAWCHEFEGGRAFYTALGHDTLLFTNDAYLGHVLGGILWATGAARGDCG
jgi:type 1 glutamine amidotransferase